MKSKLPAIIGGIVGVSILAFLCGMILTVMVIMPARESAEEGGSVTAEPTIGPHIGRTPAERSPTPTYVVIILTPEPPEPTPTPTPTMPGTTSPLGPSATTTTTPAQRPTTAPSPTPTPRFPFYYVEGSRVPAAQCLQPYLKGLVIDANGDPLDGMTLRWQRWGQSEFYVSGSDPTAPRGEWKFTYYADDPGRATDFVLQIVESEQNPVPLSEPLVLHYAGCGETGQVTNIVFKRR